MSSSHNSFLLGHPILLAPSPSRAGGIWGLDFTSDLLLLAVENEHFSFPLETNKQTISVVLTEIE